MHSSKIGSRIAKMRELKEVSQEELASRTGLDVDFLRDLEESGPSPALGPLLKISRALGTRLGTFLDDAMSSDPLITRLEEREEEMSLLKGAGKPSSLHFYSLGKGKTDRHMEPFFIRLEPHSAEEDLFSAHEGEEFVVVVSGSIEVTYGQERYELEPGDSIYYNSAVPHSVACRSEHPAEMYAVLYYPG